MVLDPGEAWERFAESRRCAAKKVAAMASVAAGKARARRVLGGITLDVWGTVMEYVPDPEFLAFANSALIPRYTCECRLGGGLKMFDNHGEPLGSGAWCHVWKAWRQGGQDTDENQNKNRRRARRWGRYRIRRRLIVRTAKLRGAGSVN